MPLDTEKLEIAGIDAQNAYDLPQESTFRNEALREITERELESLTGWLDSASGIEGFSDKLKRHTSGTYTYKKALLESLYFIYECLRAPGEELALAPESEKTVGIIAALLSEGIGNCTPGFQDRVNLAVAFLSNADISIKQLLFEYRVSLVEQAFNKKSKDVHVYNSFFRVAKILGFGVRALSLDDVYRGRCSDNDIQKALFDTFRSGYTPLNILLSLLGSIKLLLAIHHAYSGKQEGGYVQQCFDGWLLFLKVLLEEEEEDYALLLTDEDSNVIDINWGVLSKKILSYLVSHNILLFDASNEENLINDFCLTIKDDETSHRLLGEEKYILFAILGLIDELCDEAKSRVLKALNSLLIHAASIGDTGLALALINMGANIEATDKYGRTAFMSAAILGKKETALALIERGANLDAFDNMGWTALMHAVIQYNNGIVLVLIQKGANIDAVDREGKTALMYAAWQAQKETVLALIENGANIDAVDREGRTALSSAAILGKKETALALIERGANLDAFDNIGWTALMYALIEDKEEIALALIKNGASLDVTDNFGRTALIHAVIEDKEKIALALIKKSASLDVTDNFGRTALIHAVVEDKEKIALALIKNGASFDVTDNFGRTALMYAATRLVDYTLGLNKQGVNGNGALVAPGEMFDDSFVLNESYKRISYKRIIFSLIRGGADVNLKDYVGRDVFSHLPEEMKDEVRAAVKYRDEANLPKRARASAPTLFFGKREGGEEVMDTNQEAEAMRRNRG